MLRPIVTSYEWPAVNPICPIRWLTSVIQVNLRHGRDVDIGIEEWSPTKRSPLVTASIKSLANRSTPESEAKAGDHLKRIAELEQQAHM